MLCMPNQKITYMTIFILLNIILAILIIRSNKFQAMFDEQHLEKQHLLEKFC